MNTVLYDATRTQPNIEAARSQLITSSTRPPSSHGLQESSARLVTGLSLREYTPVRYECGCRTCDRVFSSEEAFDLHRVGDYSEGRKCADNPATQGLTLTPRGIWQRDRNVATTGGDS